VLNRLDGRLQYSLCSDHLLPSPCRFDCLLGLLDPSLQVGNLGLLRGLGLDGGFGPDLTLREVEPDGICDVASSTFTEYGRADDIGGSEHELQQHTGADGVVGNDPRPVAVALDSNSCDVVVHASIYAKQKNIRDSLARDKYLVAHGRGKPCSTRSLPKTSSVTQSL